MKKPRIALLLLQFGSPEDPSYKKVFTYTSEVLHDTLFSSYHKWTRSLLIKGAILPWVIPRLCSRYRRIWLKDGPPLLVHTQRFIQKATFQLPSHVKIFIGMLYGRPSLHDALFSVNDFAPEKILIVPLFPHKTCITEKALKTSFQIIRQWSIQPQIAAVDEFAEKDFYLDAWTQKIIHCRENEYDHVLFSFHGLPQPNSAYQNSCAKTAETLAKKAFLSSYSYAFQSKVGFGKWLEPSIKGELRRLVTQGKKRIVVVPASFVADCTETLYELEYKYKNFFHRIGGRTLQLLPCLNDDDFWVKEAMRHFLNENNFS